MQRALHGRQAGVSLVEFMVAGLIGLILTFGLFQIFISNRQAFDTTMASANVQETGRIAADVMTRSIRNADYWGCVDLANVFNNLDDTGSGYSADVLGFGAGIEGTDNNADTSDSIIDGTDTITLRGTRGSLGIQIDSPMPNSSAILDVNSANGLAAEDIILLSNCRGGDIFQISAITGSDNIQHNTGGSISPGNGKNSGPCAGGGGGSNCLSQLYDVGASVMVPYSETYFIGTGVSGEPALFVSAGNMSGAVGTLQTIELVEGVENMQILYGEDTNGNGSANQYSTASAVGDMQDVVSIRVSFLVRSTSENVLDSAQTLTFNGAAVDGSDLRLRRVYTMTSTVRNRM